MVKVSHDYNLNTTYPTIAQFWHPSKNGTVKPTDVLPCTKKKYWWFDPKCNHEWFKSVSRMVRNYQHRANKAGGSGCPFCNTTKVNETNCVSSTNPNLSKEWHQPLNGDLTPFDVTAGSNKKVYWKCKYGHIWAAQIYNRARPPHTGCPHCFHTVSRPQLAIYAQLKIIFPETQICKRINGTEFDIYIDDPSPIAIEYDGYPWHLKASDADIKKNKFAELLGIKLIRVRDKKLGQLSGNDILIDGPKSKLDFIVMKPIISAIMQTISTAHPKYASLSNYMTRNSFLKDGIALYKTLRNDLILGTPIRRIDKEVPEIAKDWDHKENGDLKPHMVSTGSELRVWWICKRGHKKHTRVDLRVRSKGCVLCKRMDRLAYR